MIPCIDAKIMIDATIIVIVVASFLEKHVWLWRRLHCSVSEGFVVTAMM